MQRRANLSKVETYYFFTVGTLGALALLYGAYTDNEETMDMGKNLMAHAVTVHYTDKPVVRLGSLIGAVSSIFAPGPISNVISAGSGLIAVIEKGEQRGYTF